MEDDLLELEEVLSSIDDEERCVRLIGHAIHEAYSEDDDFRSNLRPLVAYLQRKSQGCSSTKNFHYQDAFNHFIVSAYHASRAAELLFSSAREYAHDRYQYSKLIAVHHSFGPSAVFALASARNLMILDVVRESLGNIAAKTIEIIFDARFSRLTDARNALAHQDERVLAVRRKTRRQKQDKPIEGRDPFAHSQSDGQAGADLFGLMDWNHDEFGVNVGSEKILGLVSDLKLLFAIP